MKVSKLNVAFSWKKSRVSTEAQKTYWANPAEISMDSDSLGKNKNIILNM